MATCTCNYLSLSVVVSIFFQIKLTNMHLYTVCIYDTISQYFLSQLEDITAQWKIYFESQPANNLHMKCTSNQQLNHLLDNVLYNFIWLVFKAKNWIHFKPGVFSSLKFGQLWIFLLILEPLFGRSQEELPLRFRWGLSDILRFLWWSSLKERNIILYILSNLSF